MAVCIDSGGTWQRYDNSVSMDCVKSPAGRYYEGRKTCFGEVEGVWSGGGGRGERVEVILDFKPILSRKHGIIIYYLLLPLEDLIPVYRRPLEEPTLLPAVA